ncbi:nickel/cobalt transporter [Marinomonas sp. 15G1-11]|uniref:Nickel/cobalt efflux system n=1 Tax=Marinomonas phaeophyticola TaxID=3004091 RepID=A0ABT4JV36_9GAMM|nr:nickel/cobalt transporter [Marinomonas sp. 15G1-11]MCZ2721907.1 nickel/cobalt transporter [Marinomonas sp. 15G1-11]
MKFLLSTILLCLLLIVWFVFRDVTGYQSITHWLMSQQLQFHRNLVISMRSLSEGSNVGLLMSCVGVSFLYGVFHAVGPGHGKAVISSYMLASHASIRQGVGLSLVSAFAQGLMAVLCVLLLGYVFDLAGQATRVSRLFEMASFMMITLMGVWMLIRILRNKPACCDHHHDHDHDHDHEPHTYVEPCHLHGSQPHDAFQKRDNVQRYAWWSMIGAIGIRPCSGAILVLLFSLSAGILHWGILATFAMSLGTAITVSVLAAMSVLFRQSVYSQSSSLVWRERLMKGFGLIASMLLILIGVSMLVGYFNYSDRML